jgi:hypothetical protein
MAVGKVFSTRQQVKETSLWAAVLLKEMRARRLLAMHCLYSDMQSAAEIGSGGTLDFNPALTVLAHEGAALERGGRDGEAWWGSEFDLTPSLTGQQHGGATLEWEGRGGEIKWRWCWFEINCKNTPHS